MKRAPELICDVGEAEFEERVRRSSSECFVVVDFWTPWCAPCQMLGPQIEKMVAAFVGQRSTLADDYRSRLARVLY